MALGCSYYAPGHSKKHHAQIACHGEMLTLSYDDRQIVYTKRDIRLSPHLGNTPRMLYFPDGGTCEVADNAHFNVMFQPKGNGKWIAWWERSRHMILLSLVGLVVITGVLVLYVIPASSDRLAQIIPHRVDDAIGGKVFDLFEEQVFSPSSLDEERQRHIHKLFETLAAGEKGDFTYRLYLREGNSLGANALAFPGGNIVMTDAWVRQFGEDDALAGVLLHEMGHIRYRHGIRAIIENGSLLFLFSLLLGDLSSASSTVTTVTVSVLNNGYSRDHEREADRYSYEAMQKRGMDMRAMAAMFETLENRDIGSEWGRLFATHPSSTERSERFKNETGAEE